jgi:hypothetical protein
MAAPAPSQTAPRSARRGRRGLTDGLSMREANAEGGAAGYALGRLVARTANSERLLDPARDLVAERRASLRQHLYRFCLSGRGGSRA